MIPEKLRYRYRRFKLGRAYRHMAELHPSFSLQQASIDHPTSVLWRGKSIAPIIPLSHLADIHPGRSGFIVASGPSVKDMDLQSLQPHVTFCVNGSYLKYKESGHCPDYAVICDASFVSDRWSIVESTMQSGTHCLFTPSVISRICEIKPGSLQGIKLTVIQTHFRHYGQPAEEAEEVARKARDDPELITADGRVGFSLNPVKGLFTAHTVTHLPVQLCWFLGIRQIYILGMDLGGPDQARFYEQGASATPSYLARDYQRHIEPAFEVVAQMRQTHNFNVYNLSDKSRLPSSIIPKITLDEALQRSKTTLSDPPPPDR